MNVIDRFIHHVNQTVQNRPEQGWNQMRLGFRLNKLRTRILPKKHMTKGYQRLEALVMSPAADCLGHEERYVWGNIFAPCELMQCFGLSTLSVEMLSCFFSGYRLENHFIDAAQTCGIAPTLCSYHKGFVGAVESGAVRAPRFSVATSLSCDGNLSTFRYLERRTGVPCFFLDVPAQSDEESVLYLKNQLIALSQQLEERFQTPFSEERLRHILTVENETRGYLEEFFRLQSVHRYPGELICQMYLFMASHLLIGTEEFRDLMKFMVEEIKTYPSFEGKTVLWSHVVPFYQETLRAKFEPCDRYQLIAGDLYMDYREPLDVADPFGVLAKKLINNIYNLPYAEKAQRTARLAEEIHADAMIYFCHWGCKQIAGGSILMKEAMRRRGIPTLILDGDGLDRRNSHDGQIKTRLEAFLERLEEH